MGLQPTISLKGAVLTTIGTEHTTTVQKGQRLQGDEVWGYQGRTSVIFVRLWFISCIFQLTKNMYVTCKEWQYLIVKLPPNVFMCITFLIKATRYNMQVTPVWMMLYINNTILKQIRLTAWNIKKNDAIIKLSHWTPILWTNTIWYGLFHWSIYQSESRKDKFVWCFYDLYKRLQHIYGTFSETFVIFMYANQMTRLVI